MGQMIGNVGVKTGNLVTTDNGGDRELCAINLFFIFFFLFFFFFFSFLYWPIFILWPICLIFASMSSIVQYSLVF